MNTELQQLPEFEEVLAEFKKMMNLKDDIVVKLYTTFFQTGAVSLEKLKEAIAHEEHDAIKFHAHSIKGSSSSVCYGAISSLSKMIEERAGLKENDVYAKPFNELSEQFEMAQHNYTLWLGKRDS